jgi:hypothetical protein
VEGRGQKWPKHCMYIWIKFLKNKNKDNYSGRWYGSFGCNLTIYIKKLTCAYTPEPIIQLLQFLTWRKGQEFIKNCVFKALIIIIV